MFRNAPGLPPTSTCPPVLVPPPGVVNWVSAQSVSRKVLSETVCAAAGVASAKTVAITGVNEASQANLALVPRAERIMAFSLGTRGKFFTPPILSTGDSRGRRLHKLWTLILSKLGVNARSPALLESIVRCSLGIRVL